MQWVYVMSDSPVQPFPEKLSQTQQALRTLRTRIVHGEFEPGQRLPSFGQLESQLGVGRTVLQQAITMLKDDGFVTSLPRQGLYIAQSPPHLGRYAIVFPCFPDHRQWSGFHGATIAEARRIADEKSQIKFEYYQGVNDERRGGVVLDSLLTEVTAQRLAGVILLPETHDLAAQPDVVASGVPMLMIDGERGMTPRPQICTDIPMLFDRSLAWLGERGRKRIAMVYMADTFPWLTPKHFDNAGTVYHKAWVQRIGRSHPQTVSEVVHLLMDYPKSRRPDGLFIADDNLIQRSLSSLLELNLQVGQDLDVIAHCNWPHPVQSKVPMQRIGFHAGQLLEACLQVFPTIHPEKQDDRVLTIPALFESEVSQMDWKQPAIAVNMV